MPPSTTKPGTTSRKALGIVLAITLSLCMIGIVCAIYHPFAKRTNWDKLAGGYTQPKVDAFLQDAAKTTTAGQVPLNTDLLRDFNQLANDYALYFMPEVDWYQFDNVGGAIWYVIFNWTGKFASFPEQAPKLAAEARIRKLFAAPNDQYPPLQHQEYRKYVRFDGSNYSLWPESYNADTMVYDLVDLKAESKDNFTYYTAKACGYSFNVKEREAYEPSANDLFLDAKKQAYQVSATEALARMLANGEIKNAQKDAIYTIVFRVQKGSSTPQFCQIQKTFPGN